MQPSTVPSGCDVGVSPHAADQRSDWLAAEAVECHVKFSRLKSPMQCGLSSKLVDHLFLICYFE